MVYLLLIVNILINWVVIGSLVTFIWILFAPRPSWIPIIIITTAFMGLVLIYFSSSRGEKYFRSPYRQLLKIEHDHIYPTYLEVFKRTSLEKLPVLMMSDSTKPNASVMGNHTIILTRGLLENHPTKEVAAVIAHEFGHIVNGDARRKQIAWIISTTGGVPLEIVVTLIMAISANGRRVIFAPFIMLALGIKMVRGVLNFALNLALFAIDRKNEYKADDFAKKIGLSKELVAFFSKIEGKQAPHLFSTHPAREKRIKRLGYS